MTSRLEIRYHFIWRIQSSRPITLRNYCYSNVHTSLLVGLLLLHLSQLYKYLLLVLGSDGTILYTVTLFCYIIHPHTFLFLKLIKMSTGDMDASKRRINVQNADVTMLSCSVRVHRNVLLHSLFFIVKTFQCNTATKIMSITTIHQLNNITVIINMITLTVHLELHDN